MTFICEINQQLIRYLMIRKLELRKIVGGPTRGPMSSTLLKMVFAGP